MSEPMAKPRTMIDLDEFERRLRRPAPAAAPQGDPLAELARLVGNGRSEPQIDPLDQVFSRNSAARSAAEAASPRRDDRAHPLQPAAPRPHPLRGDFAAIEAGLRGSIPPEFADIGSARPRAAQPEPLAAHAQDYDQHYAGHAGLQQGADADWDDGDDNFLGFEPAAQREPQPRSRRLLYATAAIIVVGLAGIGTTFLMKGPSSGAREIAVIKAAEGPIKVQADVGASDKPDQGASILDKGPQPAPVALVNRIEQPVDMGQATPPQTDKAPRVVTLSSAQLATGAATVPVPPPPGQATAPVPPPSPDDDMIEPKKVKTISVRPDGTVMPNDAAAAQLPIDGIQAPLRPPSAAAKAATPKAPAHVATTPKTQVATSEEGTRVPTQEDPNAAPPEAARSRSTAKPVNVATAEPEAADSGERGTFAVQLAAPASEEQARQMMNLLAKKYGSILSGHHLGYHRASVDGKSVYRVRVGSLSHDNATALCQKLQASGGTCFVAKN